MELFDLEQVKEDVKEAESVTVETNVDKLKAFAEVDDSPAEIRTTPEMKEDLQLDFDVDFDTLDKINASEEVTPIIDEDIQSNVVKEVPINSTTQKEHSQSDVSKDKTVVSTKSKVDKFDAIVDKVDEYGDKAVTQIGTWLKQAAKKLVLYVPTMLSNYQDKKIHKKFEKGDLVIADNFQFLMYQGELMVYKYTGTSQHILIPDYVGNLPVRYVYKGFLNKNIFDNHRVRTVLSYFKEDNISELSLDALKDSVTGVKSIQLPKELVYIPKNLFSGTGNLDMVIVPNSVRLVSPSAFSKSNISKIYFDGCTPKNLKQLQLSENSAVYCRKEYEQEYQDELSERRAS